MSRRKKQPHGLKKRPSRPLTEAQKDQALIDETTRIFSCFTEITHDFLHQCANAAQDVASDIDYNRLAIQMWTGGPGRASDLVEVLTDFLALRERHQTALASLRPRLAALLSTPAHDHLDDVDRWRDLIRHCVTTPCATPP